MAVAAPPTIQAKPLRERLAPLVIPAVFVLIFATVLVVAPASWPKLITGILLPGLTLAAIYFMLSAGLSLIFGLMDVLNFAHGSLFMLGGYCAWTCNQWLDPAYPGHWPLTIASGNLRFIIGLVVGALVGAAVGSLIEISLIRPLYKRPIYQVLLTLGLVFVFDALVRTIPAWGSLSRAPIKPPMLTESLSLLGRRFPSYSLFLICLSVSLAVIIAVVLRRSRIGLTIRAGVQDSAMVEAMGINVRRVFTGVFGFGSGLAALGGAVAASFIGVYPEMGLEYQLFAFIVVVIGGLGSYSGAAAGALLIGLARTFSDHLVLETGLPTAIASASTVLVMAVVLLLKPGGIFNKN
ncbi:branched-chain amino acid ABC transporter permease [Herpetosiphon llansteffanensis]|uniref:branched-chain amino acid ABC transporter permease n=1 Tax=Herpetosiphon llansteffanensis TaxID=2094568 RepID=UPI000D7C8208|nr:branched-chain amino acid ABC transporter permease [Herpetosiphon llansteffanensis]